jgi:hypothetical protein
MRFTACKGPSMSDMTQSPVRFGHGDGLLGMLTEPVQCQPLPVCCLMLNMGANHRVGPRRINVKLAHALAAQGMSSLRLDLGGIGDSEAPGGASAVPLALRAVHDLQAAMDLVEARLGIRRFVIVGMCSGAEHAMSAGMVDARVIGLSLFDGFAFPQRRARWERTLRRALAAPAHPAFAGKVRRWIGRGLSRWLSRSGAARPLPGFFSEELPPVVAEAWFRATMRRLWARQVALHFLYSGSLHVSDRGRDQLGAFRDEPFLQAAQYDFLRDLDHTVCTARGQQLFLGAVGDWAIARARGTAAERRSPGTAAAPLEPPIAGALAPQ